MVRIEIDGDQYHVVAPRRQRLAVYQHVFVERIVEGEPAMALQGGVLLADAVELGDFGDDIAGRVKVAMLDFIFLGIEIFLAARQRRGLAQFETRIHSPQT